MTKFTEREAMLLKSFYFTFIDEYDDYAFDTNRYDFRELNYQMNNIEKCDIDSCEFHGRYGDYISRIIIFCDMLGISDVETKDAILEKLRNSFAKIMSSDELFKKYNEIRDNSPAMKRERELYGDDSTLAAIMQNMMF